MYYEYTLTIPRNTTEAAPLELGVALAPGVVRLVHVQFPKGCVGLVHVQIWRSEHQVWPVNVEGNISAEGQTVSWPEDYELADDPLSFTLRGWNDDDTFPHTITFRFALLPLAAAQAEREGPGMVRQLLRFLTGGA